MKATRILLADMPRIIQDMVGAIISTAPGLRIVGTLASEAELLPALRRTRADVVIIQEKPDTEEIDAPTLVVCCCKAKVVAINDSGREAALYKLRLERLPFGEVSAATLVSAIEKAVNR